MDATFHVTDIPVSCTSPPCPTDTQSSTPPRIPPASCFSIDAMSHLEGKKMSGQQVVRTASEPPVLHPCKEIDVALVT